METTSPSSLVEKARTFARTLASSEEFEEYYSLKQKLKNDPEAQSLLEELERKHQELRNSMVQNTREDLYEEIEKLQKKLRTNETIMNWLSVEQIAMSMIREANEVISMEAGFDFGQKASSISSC